MESGCRTFLSNRLEDLLDHLAGSIGHPLEDPFEPECVIVQSQGMARYLSLELAGKWRICANMSFRFPVVFFYDLFRLLLPETATDYPFAMDAMAWELMDILPDFAGTPEGFPVARYLEEDEDLKRYQLAEKIAYHFDQYLIFRPDMIQAWERGEYLFPDNEHEIWQASLWCKLADRLGIDGHRAALTERFLAALAALDILPKGFPHRISIFGISSLPPMYLRILHALGQHIPVAMYLLSPCQEYWADIVSRKEKARLMARHEGDGDMEYLEAGNDLLASLGHLGRHFQDLLIMHGLVAQDVQIFTPPHTDSLLHEIQEDILSLQNPPREGRGDFEIDDSLCIASCHSPMREMEALHDHLLDRLDTLSGCKDSPPLMPENIVVMCPDIGTYAPYIEAVFGARRGEPTFIPFHIADQTKEQEHPAIKSFFQILDLTSSRLEVSAVLALLDSSFFREKFELTLEDTDAIRAWAGSAGIRWGADERFKKELGLPGFRENTWASGIERMLLGLMMPGAVWKTEEGEGRSAKNGWSLEGGEAGNVCTEVIVPFDRIEGGQAEVLGRFVDFVHMLFYHVDTLKHPRLPGEWKDALLAMIRDLMQAGEVLAEGLLELTTGVEEVFARAEKSGFSETMDLATVRYLLRSAFADGSSGMRFLSGGVTFCTLQPMRSIPFRVMCLVGLSDGAFPRQDRSPGFDLLRAAPRKGDRSMRMDDRYLFLEAIISAREEIYFSYVGQDVRDNTTLPPSVLLCEVMDYLDRYYPVQKGKLSELLTIKHRLQGFHPDYFTPAVTLKSYVPDNLQGAVKLLQPRTSLPFMQTDSSAREQETRDLSLDALIGFWKNPARFLVQRRLGISLYAQKDSLQDVEPLECLDSLTGYLLGQELVQGEPGAWDEAYVRTRGANLLPPGSMGEQQFKHMRADVEAMRARRAAVIGEERPMEPLTGTILCRDHEIQAVLPDVYPGGQVVGRFATAKGKDFLGAWINHLALQLLTPVMGMRTTWMISKDGTWRFDPLDDARELLEDLLTVFDQGMHHCLPFFPQSSHAFALDAVKNIVSARSKARKAWESSKYSHGEDEDLYFSLCFRDVDPLDASFEEMAVLVFGPILERVDKEG